MSVRLWIDDDDWSGTRTPPSSEWTWAKTSQEAIDILRAAGAGVAEVSFDHDLGKFAACRDCSAPPHDETTSCCAYCYHDDTTRAVVLWMCENDAFPPVCRIHTANAIGREWIEGMINRYGPGVTEGAAQ